MKIACLAFTDKGMALARRLAAALGGAAERCGQPHSLHQWTGLHFPQEDALLYVGAVGIAVRAIAPFVQSKTTDPAVVVVDECAHFAVPVLSGHLGGANALARRVAALCGAVPVLTTATDANGLFAVDEWARCQGCAVLHAGQIRRVSAAILAGRTVRVRSEFPIAGEPPERVQPVEQGPYDVYLGFAPQPEDVLWLAPRVLALGLGCRKGTAAETLEAAFAALQIPEQAVCATASIDLKREEAGLLAFCSRHGWTPQFYSAAQLARVEGTFASSPFVAQTTGVDNVCERAAVLAGGPTLLRRKTAGQGVTMAVSCRPFELNWRWQDEG